MRENPGTPNSSAGSKRVEHQIGVMARQCANVELRRPDRLEHGAPHDGEQHRPHHRPHGHEGVDFAEFALVDAATDQAFHERQAAADHFLQVEPADLGKGARFGDDQLGNGSHRRCLDAVGHEFEDAWQQRRHRPAMALEHRFHLTKIAGDRMLHHALEQGDLVGEVEVDRGLGEPGALGHVVEARAGKPRLHELGESCVDDLLRPGGGRATLFRRFHVNNLPVS